MQYKILKTERYRASDTTFVLLQVGVEIIVARVFMKMAGMPDWESMYYTPVEFEGEAYGQMGTEPDNANPRDEEAYELIEKYVPIMRVMGTRKRGAITIKEAWVKIDPENDMNSLPPQYRPVLFLDSRDNRQKVGKSLHGMYSSGHYYELEGQVFQDKDHVLTHWQELPKKPLEVRIAEQQAEDEANDQILSKYL